MDDNDTFKRLEGGREKALEEIRTAFGLPEEVDAAEVAICALWNMVEIYRRAGQRKLVFVPHGDTDLIGICSREQWEYLQKQISEAEAMQPGDTLN